MVSAADESTATGMANPSCMSSQGNGLGGNSSSIAIDAFVRVA